jgi:DMSO/TMAO reductase YedYZ molybdopterin-dependent catalytic subunit
LGRVLEAQQEATGAGQPLADLVTATPEPTAATQPSPSAQSLGGAPTETPAAGTSPLPSSTPLPQPTVTATMRDGVQPAPGTRLELTPNEDFYRIDINTRPVSIEGASWVLEVDGLFDNPRPLTLSDLTAYAAATQAITLSCISNPVAGDLISTSNWTGVRLRDVLKDLGLRPEAEELYIEAADGFYESVAMEDLMDPRTLLVYGMNGETLPVEHGFPLRIYIPNRYGMKQPKWIKRIEAIDHQGPGYWVERGWSAEARVQIVSVIDTVAKDHVVDGKVPVGGIAWAGDRGIQKVEVQVDDGEWAEAVLRTPPLSSLTWVQWRYDWPMSTGRHRFRVRATDGTGALQIEEVSGVQPDGATGYHLVTVDI